MNSEILEKLRELKPQLKEKFGIEEFAIFGSYARGEEKKDSDIDIAILEIKQKNLLNRLEAKEYLENFLDKKIDIGYFSSMKTFIKNRIEKEFVYV